jgi:ABC-type branched-subunit amino acid transport system ATPase component
MSALVLEAVSKSFGGLKAVDALSFSVPAGAVYSVIGPNGSGKTTCFNLISGFLRPDAGRVVLMGEEVTGQPAHRLARRGIARTFQHSNLFDSLSVLDNVVVALHRLLDRGFWRNLLRGALPDDGAVHAIPYLRLVGLEARRDATARTLTFADRRRLELAIALATAPRLLLLDEPTAGLTPEERTAFMQLLVKLRESERLTILLVEHNIRMVMRYSDFVVVLNKGAKLAEGPPAQVAADPRVIETYLARAKEQRC